MVAISLVQITALLGFLFTRKRNESTTWLVNSNSLSVRLEYPRF
jgi:hypothetical protein